MSDYPRGPSPQPGWKPGDKVKSPVQAWTSVDPLDLEIRELYRIAIGAIVPRPIAFVSTVNGRGEVNLAPFSFFNGVGSSPPALMFSVNEQGDGSKKDTLRNIEATKEFVVNTVGEWMLEPMNHTSARYPHGVSELEKAGLTELKSLKVKPPRVKESAVQMECVLEKLVPVGTSTVVIGRIVQFHVDKEAYNEGRISVDRLRPVARLGGISYAGLGTVWELPRPKPEGSK